MTLRRQTMLVMGVTFLALLLVMYGVCRVILMQGFAQVEEQRAQEKMTRAVSGLGLTLRDLEVPLADWSRWDDTYQFVRDRNEHYIEVNLLDESIATLHLNLVLVLNNEGREVFGTGFDLEKGRKVSVPESLRAHLKPGALLLDHTAGDEGLSGLISLPKGPMLIAARPILTSKGEGPSRGTLIFGRYLDAEVVARLSALTGLSLGAERLDGPGVSRKLGPERPVLVEPVSERQMAGHGLLRDIYGRPCLALRALMPRPIHQQAEATLSYLLKVVLALGLVFSGVMLLLLERGVLSRLARLSAAVAAIGRRGDFSARLEAEGGDELSSLAASVNGMLASLERSQESLKESEVRFRSVAQTATDAIISADQEGRVVFWNDAAQAIFGYPAAEALGRPLTMILPEGEEDGGLAGLCSRLLSRRTELAGRRRDGSQVAVEVSLASWATREGVFYTAIVRDVTARQEAERRLTYLSLHDPLTGLYSRAYFEQEMQRLQGGRKGAGVVLCDVDGLKLTNDTLGHDRGDVVLKAAAEVLRQSVRQGDMLSRIGGDEFAVLLPGAERGAVEAVAARIRENVARYNAANPELPLSLSTGFAHDPQASSRELFKEADNNMYREKLHRSKSARSAIVQTLMKALEARDFITEGHADRLQELVASVAVALGLPEHSISDLRLMAQFHDIGKVGIPDRILFKPGPLTPAERVEMQRHSEIGFRIAQSAPDLAPIADWVLKHHEAWDGTGYPLGLQGEDIPLECRILAVADAYDAMTSDRPYRKAMPHEQAAAELRRCAGGQFDPQVVEQFVDLLEFWREPPTPQAAQVSQSTV
jgi:diguanylate cyclase (GGDEF)-like protein/PAS domain S-box-containing protein